MVRYFFNKISAPIRGLHQAAYVLALLTLASQVLALLRDRAFASAFGAGPVLDVYYGAFRIPDLVFALVASLVSAYVLIPRIAEKGSDEVKTILSQSLSFVLIVGGGISLVVAYVTPFLITHLYPVFIGTSYESEIIFLTRLLLLQPIILGLSGLFSSVTQVHRRFILFALSPVLYNAGIIFGALVLYPRYGLSGIGFGVLAGALLHAGLHIPILVGAKVLPRLIVPKWRILKSIVHDSMPRSLALGMGSFTLLVLTALASRVASGSISVFTLALNLEAVPLSLIGASYAVAAFPALSEHRANENHGAFFKVLSTSARHIVLWSLIFLSLIAVLRAHIVRIVLGAGAFDWDATRLTAALLAIFAAGLVAQGLTLLFSRALYAAQQSWWPFLYQAVGGLVTIGAALLLLTFATSPFMIGLSAFLRVSEVNGAPILLLALAFTLGQWFVAVWSLFALSRIAPGLARSLVRPFAHGVLAMVLGGLATYGVLAIEGGIAPLTTLAAVFTEGFIAGMVGLAVSAGVLALLKNEEFIDLAGALTRLSGHSSTLPPSAVESA
jgi:putative peptidoglycan lipid II flippase